MKTISQEEFNNLVRERARHSKHRCCQTAWFSAQCKVLPINVKSANFQEQKKLAKKLELPKHDPKRVYYGPENSLFPKLDLSSFEEVKINK
jgi:hypothetical protein